MLSLFLLFFFAFIFTSLIAHICSSVIENVCSALRFFVVQARGSFRYHGEKLYHHLFFAYGILYITTPANLLLFLKGGQTLKIYFLFFTPLIFHQYIERQKTPF